MMGNEPALKYPDGYQELNLPFDVGGKKNIFSDLESPEGLFLRFLGHGETKRIFGFVKFGPLAGGPPKASHGGAIAYVLDEAMGTAAWNQDYPVVSERIEIRYRQFVPQGTLLTFEAYVERVDSDRVFVKAMLKNENQAVLSDAEGTFHILDAHQLKSLAKIAGVEVPPELLKPRKEA